MHNDQIKRRKNEELTVLTVLRDSDRKFRLKLGFLLLSTTLLTEILLLA
jgi:hypothetical protein